jgi:hypothetical protein
MIRMLFACLSLLACTACGSGDSAVLDPPTHLRAVAVTPAEVHAGETALLDFTVVRAEVPRAPRRGRRGA